MFISKIQIYAITAANSAIFAADLLEVIEKMIQASGLR